MSNMTAEPVAGASLADDDKNLIQRKESSAKSYHQPQLRIVHSADRRGDSSSRTMPSSGRHRQASDRPPGMLDRTVQAQIGRLLRDVFAGVAREPVPERFVALLAELETKEEKSR